MCLCHGTLGRHRVDGERPFLSHLLCEVLSWTALWLQMFLPASVLQLDIVSPPEECEIRWRPDLIFRISTVQSIIKLYIARLKWARVPISWRVLGFRWMRLPPDMLGRLHILNKHSRKANKGQVFIVGPAWGPRIVRKAPRMWWAEQETRKGC